MSEELKAVVILIAFSTGSVLFVLGLALADEIWAQYREQRLNKLHRRGN